MTMLSRFATLGGLPGDPYWANVSYLLIGNGANGTTTNIKDSSSNNVTTTVNGNTVISTAISPPTVTNAGSGTVYFDGNGDYLNYPYSANFQFSGDFTIETWANIDASQLVPYPCIVSNYSAYAQNGGMALLFNTPSSANKYSLTINATDNVIKSSSNVITNAWFHIAIVRSGSTVALYLNGSLEGTYTYSGTIQGTQNYWWVGASGDAITLTTFKGYVYDFRVTKGVARYTASFTPPPFPPTAAMLTY